MTLLGRSIIESTGYTGAPGYNVVHWSGGFGAGPNDPDGVEEFHDNLETLLLAVAGYLRDQGTWTVLPDVVHFDDSDGVILGSVTDPGGARIVEGSGSGAALSTVTQACCALSTDRYVGGRRLQGRMFLGPIAATALDSNGQISVTAAPDIAGNFSGLISGLGGRLAVWHRPPVGNPTGGDYGDVITVTTRFTPGTLRSRKT